MSTTSSPDRRFIFALTAAVASATLAIGATAGGLLGWLGPRTTPDERGGLALAGAGSAQVVYVPITPTGLPSPPASEPFGVGEPRVAMAEPGSHRDDRDEHHEHHEHYERADHAEDDDD